MKDALHPLLEKRYPCSGRSPAWALMYEVRDKGGFASERALDVMAVSLWPSGGYEIHGIEIKRSRSDWMRERGDAEKSNAFFPYCDRFWLLTTKADIVRDGELPETWGHMVAKAKVLQTVVKAPKLTPQQPPRALIATMLKRATDEAPTLRELNTRLKQEIELVKQDFEAYRAQGPGAAHNSQAMLQDQRDLQAYRQLQRQLEEAGMTRWELSSILANLGGELDRRIEYLRERLVGLERALDELEPQKFIDQIRKRTSKLKELADGKTSGALRVGDADARCNARKPKVGDPHAEDHHVQDDAEAADRRPHHDACHDRDRHQRRG